MKWLVLLSIFIVFFQKIQAQQEPDTTTVLEFDEYYRLVLANHPVVKQAELLTQQAAQELRLARGGFDPKLEGSWSFKDFNETEYYNILDVSLKIPVWFPIDPKVGVERNRGTYLNNERFISPTTDNRQIYAGISVPIGQGLFIDQRRATMRQAQLMQDMAEADQVKEINKILLTAAKDYWEWYFAYNNYVLMQRSITIAQDIYDRTKMAFEYGEAAAMDTVQAKITLLQRVTAFQEANIERIKASLRLSLNLWDPNGAPLDLEDNVRPEDMDFSAFNRDLLDQLVEMARQNHPEILKLDLKNNSLMVERDLARENLKPRLDVNYFLLDQPISPGGEQNGIAVGDNYKVGVDFAFPIFLRKERAKLNQTRLKLTDNRFQRDFVEREIINDINGQFNAVLTTEIIMAQQEEMVNNYEVILQAEQLNLENGESDLFEINVQIEKLIDSQSKLLKLRSDYQKNIMNLYWAAGITNLGLQ
ncbi:MAG: TolC family protein [Cytophagales bacterium]|nr:TolC family protein [Cytophagales bacterium]